MSFNLNRINNQISKKNITISNSINSNSLKASVGSTGIATIANINTLTLNGTTVTVTANQINKTQITSTGNAESSKLLVLDNNTNISNINSLSCNTLIVNGENITANTFQVSSSNDTNNQYLTNITKGIGSASKALVFDNTKNLSNFNTLSVENLIINNVNIKNIYNENKSLLFKNFEELYPNIHSLNTNYLNTTYFKRMSASGGNNTTILNDYYWPAVCYSSELQLFVSVCNGIASGTVTTNRVITSKDGQNWIVQNAIDNNWEDIIWISKLRLFVAVSSNGTNNQIMTSSDGINWTSQITPTVSYAFSCLAWSDELNLCVAVNTSNNAIMISNDCINWKLVYSNNTRPMNKVCWSPELSLFIATTTLVTNYSYIIVSTDGTNWTQIMNISFNNITLYSISWSSYLKMFIISANSPASQQVYYSYNGYTWYNGFCSITMVTTIWIDEIKLFLGYTDNGYMAYSKNGINWTNYQVDSNTSFSSRPGKIAWSPELSIILITMRQGWTSSATGERFHLFQPHILGKKPLLLKNNSYFYYDQINKRFGFNTIQPNKPIEINSNNGNLLKLSYPTNNDNIFVTFNLTNSGQLNLTANTINISTNYLSTGLKLNNTLIQTNVSLLNNLSSITEGIAKSLLPLQVNSSNNISNINNIICNSLIVNGNNIDTTNNNIYFQNNTLGIAVDSKALITDINNDIKNINNISVNQINVNNNSIFTKQINSLTDYNLTSINNTINNKNIEIYEKLFSNYSLINVNNAAWTSLIWVSELQLYIAVASSNSTTTNRIMTSPDGKTWTMITDTLIQGYNFQSVVWSSDLQLLVAINSNTNNYRIVTSIDGINWYPQFNSSIDYNWISMIYSLELNLFVAISNDSTTAGRIMVSNTGYNWILVNNNTSITYQSIIWVDNLNLFIVTTNSLTIPFYISKDGYNWSSSNININNVTSAFKDICWSKELNMIIALTSSENTLYYSYDAYNWNSLYIPFSTSSLRKIYWISELRIFLILPNNNYIYYSNNGLKWYNLSFYPGTYRYDTLAWSSDLKNLILLTFSNSYAIIFSNFFPNNSLNTVVSQTNNLVINKTNGYIGLDINPSYQLELSTDSAAKASSSTWTFTSDIRLKENIEDADLDLCYNNFKQINLVKYKWKNNIYSNDQINDRSQLGWIAQDIEQIFPKSIITKNKFDIIDCKFLNSDQLLSTLYGTVKKLINNFESQENNINEYDIELNNIDNFLKNLEISS